MSPASPATFLIFTTLLAEEGGDPGDSHILIMSHGLNTSERENEEQTYHAEHGEFHIRLSPAISRYDPTQPDERNEFSQKQEAPNERTTRELLSEQRYCRPNDKPQQR